MEAGNRKALLVGLIGFPLEHSWSPGWFSQKFLSGEMAGAEYRLFPLRDASEFPELIRDHPGLSGVNVTTPHKISIIPYLHELDDTALEAGAVNVIRILRKAGHILLKGYNTDAAGFLSTLDQVHVNGPALILGTGGAARAVASALRQRSIPYRFVSRVTITPGVLLYENLTPGIISEHPFIINATPAGMHPAISCCPNIPYNGITSNHLLYDLIYNPAETGFLKQGREQGARTINGLQMLHAQAELSYRIFMDERI